MRRRIRVTPPGPQGDLFSSLPTSPSPEPRVQVDNAWPKLKSRPPETPVDGAEREWAPEAMEQLGVVLAEVLKPAKLHVIECVRQGKHLREVEGEDCKYCGRNINFLLDNSNRGGST